MVLLAPGGELTTNRVPP